MPAATLTGNAVNGAHAAHGGNGGNGARPFPPGGGGGEAEQGIWVCGETPLPAGLWAAAGGGEAAGGGFGQGGPLEGMAPGPEMGLLLPADVAGLGDAELTGVLRAWRRMGSWAAAMEHAAAAEPRRGPARRCGGV